MTRQLQNGGFAFYFIIVCVVVMIIVLRFTERCQKNAFCFIMEVNYRRNYKILFKIIWCPRQIKISAEVSERHPLTP